MDKLDRSELITRRDEAYRRLYAAGAHFVVDDIWDCEAVMGEIRYRLARGERP